MAKAPVVFRVVPAGIRKGLKAWLRPYARRLLEAYLDPYIKERVAQGQLPGVHPGLTASATHIPTTPRRTNDTGLWGYMRPKADPEARVWSDGLPIPPQHLWHGYTDDTDRMMQIGVDNMHRVRRVLADAGGEPQRGQKILDFGCAGGFVMRNFLDIAQDRESGGEVWGVDFSGPHIDWCVRHLMPPFRFVLTSSIPSLPFADGYFDLTYCISVFSHMGEQCEGWLAELARVTKPGGRVYLSVVTKESMRDYFEKRPALGFSTAMKRRFTPEQLESDFSSAVVGNGPGCHSVFDLEAFKAKCECAFDVISVVPNVHSFQWAVVLQRPVARAPGTGPEVVTSRLQASGLRV